MVGGKVIGITRKDNKTHLNVINCPHYPKHKILECPNPDSCCVYTDEIIKGTSKKITIEIEDHVWWQCGIVYWTSKNSKDKKTEDVQLTKIGYSH